MGLVVTHVPSLFYPSEGSRRHAGTLPRGMVIQATHFTVKVKVCLAVPLLLVAVMVIV
jgi:hypothetical protein